MAKDRIGVGWERQYGEDKRSYIAGSLDFGVLGDIPFAVFPNDNRDEDRKQPTHNIVVTVSVPGDGDEKHRVYLGAAWEREAKTGNSTYLFVKLELAKLGTVGMAGLDFTGRSAPVYGRLVRVTKDGETSPDWVFYRITDMDMAKGKGEDSGANGKEAESTEPLVADPVSADIDAESSKQTA